MNQLELLTIIKELSNGYIDKKIEGRLYARTTESLIMTNIEIVPELKEFADFLAQYSPNNNSSELFGDEELRNKIKEFLWSNC